MAAQGFSRSIKTCLAAGAEREICPLTGKAFSDCQADAATAAGDHNGTPG
jgi:hypothetical protein